MSIYIKYIYICILEEFPAGKAPREFELCAVVAFIAIKKEARVSCKENYGTVAARRYQDCRNVLRDLRNVEIAWKRTHCVSNYIKRDNCIRLRNSDKYGPVWLPVEARDFAVHFPGLTPTSVASFNFCRYSCLGPVDLTVLWMNAPPTSPLL